MFHHSSKLTNHSISEYLVFEEQFFAWCLASLKKLENLCSSTGCRVIDYRLRSGNFRWYCPLYLSRIINRRSLVFWSSLLSIFALRNNLLYNSRINNAKIPQFFFPKCSDSSRKFFPLLLHWNPIFLEGFARRFVKAWTFYFNFPITYSPVTHVGGFPP